MPVNDINWFPRGGTKKRQQDSTDIYAFLETLETLLESALEMVRSLKEAVGQ